MGKTRVRPTNAQQKGRRVWHIHTPRENSCHTQAASGARLGAKADVEWAGRLLYTQHKQMMYPIGRAVGKGGGVDGGHENNNRGEAEEMLGGFQKQGTRAFCQMEQFCFQQIS